MIFALICSAMLAPPSVAGNRIKPVAPASVSLASDFNSGSDSEEIPYTGERPSALPKVRKIEKNLLARRE